MASPRYLKYASMREEIYKISAVRLKKSRRPIPKSGQVMDSEPGSMDVTKVGAGAVGKLIRKAKYKVLSGLYSAGKATVKGPQMARRVGGAVMRGAGSAVGAAQRGVRAGTTAFQTGRAQALGKFRKAAPAAASKSTAIVPTSIERTAPPPNRGGKRGRGGKGMTWGKAGLIGGGLAAGGAALGLSSLMKRHLETGYARPLPYQPASEGGQG